MALPFASLGLGPIRLTQMEIDSDLFASLNVSELDKTAIDGYSKPLLY